MSKTQSDTLTAESSIVDYDLVRDYDGCTVGVTVYDGDRTHLDSLLYQGFSVTTVTVL